jgi:NAD+ synthase
MTRPGEAELAIDPAATCRILEGFLVSEVGRTGRSRVVLGLSGGLDSAVAATLAVRALGPGSVHPLLLPHRISSPASVRHAESMVGMLGVVAEKVDITPMVDAFLGASGPVSPLRLGNVMSRVRMTLLYDRSASLDALVLGTSNKTELLLGYGTLHGDLASALNPLGDLYKTQVRALAAHLRVPAAVRRKPPSADLCADQSDEVDLGFSYDDADRILALAVDGRMSRRAVIEAGFRPPLVDRVLRRVVRSQFKRRPPVIAKVSTRSIGWDFRYPRDWKS